jgi:hypothetical protein
MKKSAHVSEDQTEMKSWFWLCYYFGAVTSPGRCARFAPSEENETNVALIGVDFILRVSVREMDFHFLLTAGLLEKLKGARVLITGRRRAPLEAVAATHLSIESFVADAAKPEDAPRTVERALALWGRLDVLVNNAGAGVPMSLASGNGQARSASGAYFVSTVNMRPIVGEL